LIMPVPLHERRAGGNNFHNGRDAKNPCGRTEGAS
jgi:hypothetical protein